MSDLLAKCDWDEGELHVYIAQWPEVVYVWVDEKTMPYAPVVADVRSLKAENSKLRDQLEEQKCFAADLERDVRALRELVMQLRKTLSEAEGEVDTCGHCELLDECAARNWHECEFDRRMRELGVEL